jgi:hypothetical protein
MDKQDLLRLADGLVMMVCGSCHHNYIQAFWAKGKENFIEGYIIS